MAARCARVRRGSSRSARRTGSRAARPSGCRSASPASSPSASRRSDMACASALSVTFAPGQTRVEQFFLGHERGRAVEQIEQQVEQLRRQLERHLAARHPVGRPIGHERAEPVSHGQILRELGQTTPHALQVHRSRVGGRFGPGGRVGAAADAGMAGVRRGRRGDPLLAAHGHRPLERLAPRRGVGVEDRATTRSPRRPARGPGRSRTRR